MGTGIDYGGGITNIDTKTGIRYGVIPVNDVLQAWADSSETVYTARCPECGTDCDENYKDDEGNEYVHWCPACKKEVEHDNAYGDEPDLIHYVEEGYVASQDSDGDIFVIKAPFYTLRGFCSPCAPGAGHLRTEGDVKTYCFGHDWFEGGKAPYPVYSVETGEIINS